MVDLLVEHCKVELEWDLYYEILEVDVTSAVLALLKKNRCDSVNRDYKY